MINKKIVLVSLSTLAGASLLYGANVARADWSLIPSAMPKINTVKEVGPVDETPTATPTPVLSSQTTQTATQPIEATTTPQESPSAPTGYTQSQSSAPVPDLTPQQIEQRRVDNLPAGTYYTCNGSLQSEPCTPPATVVITPTDGSEVQPH